MFLWNNHFWCFIFSRNHRPSFPARSSHLGLFSILYVFDLPFAIEILKKQKIQQIQTSRKGNREKKTAEAPETKELSSPLWVVLWLVTLRPARRWRYLHTDSRKREALLVQIIFFGSAGLSTRSRDADTLAPSPSQGHHGQKNSSKPSQNINRKSGSDHQSAQSSLLLRLLKPGSQISTGKEALHMGTWALKLVLVPLNPGPAGMASKMGIKTECSTSSSLGPRRSESEDGGSVLVS